MSLSTSSADPAPDSKPDPSSKPEPYPRFSSLTISAVCALLFVVHLGMRFYYGTMKDGLDTVALGLAVVGLSPWIALIVKRLKIGGVEIDFQAKVEKQGIEIEQLKLIIAHFLPDWEVEHMNKLLKREPFWMDLDNLPGDFEGELRHLRRIRFIEPIEGFKGVTDFLASQPRKQDLCKYFRVTQAGKDYLTYRTRIQPRSSAPVR